LYDGAGKIASMGGNDVEVAREWIAQARRPVIFTGAGVSADSGVPTFRGAAADALWGNCDPTQLASPQGFSADPKLVYDWYNWRRTQLAKVQPNAAHHAIARLHASRGATVITQNVDGLHERVAPAEAPGVLRLHGTIVSDRCFNWRCNYTESVDLANPPPLRECPTCGSHLRPAVVWFGESLDQDIWLAAQSACRAADVMLVVGTSGGVHPAAGLVNVASRAGAKTICVNLEPSAYDGGVDVSLYGRAAEIVPQLIP
jgi:NAD-dependent deacetylase